jgi:hypothetical protein
MAPFSYRAFAAPNFGREYPPSRACPRFKEHAIMPPLNVDNRNYVPTKSFRRGPTPSSNLLLEHERELATLLRSSFEKSGIPVDELSRLKAEIQTERRRLLDVHLAEKAGNRQAADTRFRQLTENKQQVAKLLAGGPFESTWIFLDVPFLMTNTPSPVSGGLAEIVESEAEPFASNMRIKLSTHEGGPSDGNQLNGQAQNVFTFGFLWRNPSEFAVVVNAKTLLLINGRCEVSAGAAISASELVSMEIDAGFHIVKYSGWGVDPVTGASNDGGILGSRYAEVMYMHVTGDGFFGAFGSAVNFQHSVLDFLEVGFADNLIAIPAFATAAFYVTMTIDYSISARPLGPDGADLAYVDFFTEPNRVMCSSVDLEVSTIIPGEV